MRKPKWQLALIDAELDRLRVKYRDPETLIALEGVGTEFHKEWMAWCESQEWIVDWNRIASDLRRDNVVRWKLPTDENGLPLFQAQCILALDIEECRTIRAADARQADLQEHIAMRQKQLDDHIEAEGRYIAGMKQHTADFHTPTERWIEVQDRK